MGNKMKNISIMTKNHLKMGCSEVPNIRQWALSNIMAV